MKNLAIAFLVFLVPSYAISAPPANAPAPPADSQGPSFAFHPVWGKKVYSNRNFEINPSENGGCAVADPAIPMVFCGVKDGHVYALSSLNGNEVWSIKTGGSVRGRPALTGEGLFVTSMDGCVRRLDPATGESLWKEPFCAKVAIPSGPVVANGQVHFATIVNKTITIKTNDGSLSWEHHRSPPVFMSSEGVARPAVDGDFLYTGYSDGFLVSLDRLTGEQRWATDLSHEIRGTPDVDSSPVVHDGVVYTAAFSKGPAAVKADDGLVLWRGSRFGCSQPTLVDGRLVVGTAEGEIVAFDPKDGHELYVTKIDSLAVQQTVLVLDFLVVAGDKGLWAIDPDDGFPFQQLGVPLGVTNTPTVQGRRIFFVSAGGSINAVDFNPR